MKFVVISVAKRKNTGIKRIISWAAVLLYLVMIYTLSSQDGLQSNTLSRSVVDMVRARISLPAVLNSGGMEYVVNYNAIVRKMAHFSMYFVLTMLTYIALNRSNVKEGRNVFLSLALCIACACFDEFNQGLVPDRTPLAGDAFLDVMGGTFGLISVYLLNIVREKRKEQIKLKAKFE